MKKQQQAKETTMSKETTNEVKTTKMPFKYGQQLVDDGVISEKKLDEMILNGSIANPNSNGGFKKIMMGSDGKTKVEPTLYFKGVNKTPYTKEMNELRKEFNILKEKYTTITTS